MSMHEIVKFVPIPEDKNKKAFCVGVEVDKYFVETITLNGKTTRREVRSSFGGAIELAGKKMKASLPTKYVIE